MSNHNAKSHTARDDETRAIELFGETLDDLSDRNVLYMLADGGYGGNIRTAEERIHWKERGTRLRTNAERRKRARDVLMNE